MKNLKVTLAKGQINFSGELTLHEKIDCRIWGVNFQDVPKKFWGNYCPKTGNWYIGYTPIYGDVTYASQYTNTSGSLTAWNASQYIFARLSELGGF